MNKKLQSLYLYFSILILVLFITFSVLIYVSTASSIQYQEQLKSDALIDKEKGEHTIVQKGKTKIISHDETNRNDLPQLYFIVQNDHIIKQPEYGRSTVNALFKIIETEKEYHHDYISYDNKHYYISSETINDKDNITIYTILDSTESYHALSNLKTMLIGLTSLFVLLILLLSYIMSKRAIKPYEESNKLQKQFIQDASHELKTPLAVLKTGTGVLKTYEYKNMTDIGKEVIKDLDDEINQMNQLVQDLLTLSRIEDKPLVTLDIAEVVQVIQDRFNPMLQIPIKAQNIHANVKGDQSTLVQALSILVENAIKYNNVDHLKINIKVKNTKSNVEVLFSDNGVGMKEEDIEHMFERFYRSANTRHIQGSGIGLAIFKEIMDHHHATIDVMGKDGLQIKMIFPK